MSGNSNYPTSLDDDTSLFDVTDSVTSVAAAHHNNLKEAVKRLEAKLGVYGTVAPTTIDYRLGHPTGGHFHNGASGQAPKINASAIAVPSGGFPSGGSLFSHLTNAGLHGGGDSVSRRIANGPMLVGTAIVGSNVAAPIIFGRTMQIESVSAALRRGPSGATTAFKILVGPTHIFVASVGFGTRFAPGATAYRSSATPNLITYPSGAVITLDVEAVGSSDPGRDLAITFIFRD